MVMTFADLGIIAGIVCGPLALLWASLASRMKRIEDRIDTCGTTFVSEGTCLARMSESRTAITDIGRRTGKLEVKVFDGP